MSIAYLDPGNIESDLQQGAVAQYKVRGYSLKENKLCKIWRLYYSKKPPEAI